MNITCTLKLCQNVFIKQREENYVQSEIKFMNIILFQELCGTISWTGNICIETKTFTEPFDFMMHSLKQNKLCFWCKYLRQCLLISTQRFVHLVPCIHISSKISHIERVSIEAINNIQLIQYNPTIYFTLHCCACKLPYVKITNFSGKRKK